MDTKITFKDYLDKSGEIGYVEEVVHSLVYVEGLPSIKLDEVVVFETGQIGKVMSLDKTYAEIMVFSKTPLKVGTKVARTGEFITVKCFDGLLGTVIDPLGRLIEDGTSVDGEGEVRRLEVHAPGVLEREIINEPLETGVSLVDIAVPLGKGQRELVIGDRKTGKTGFLLQTLINQASQGTVCIYAGVGKKALESKQIREFLKGKGVEKNTIFVLTNPADPAGLIYITPYTAMTLAEYFRDKGKDVLVILDDLTAHAKYYREMSLLARRFPGRSSYPGDIFYIHSRLLERAGKFKRGSISCLPVAELIFGDLSGYIQTNLMSMTDGHIYFDSDYFNQGRRPAINPFLSVTRVGQQAQSPLIRSASREITAFLVKLEKMRDFMHFGAELSEEVKGQLALGDRLLAFFEQSTDTTVPAVMSVYLVALLWSGYLKEEDRVKMRAEIERLNDLYKNDINFRKKVEDLMASKENFPELVSSLKNEGGVIDGKS